MFKRNHFTPQELKDARRTKRYCSGVQIALQTHLGRPTRLPPSKPKPMGKLTPKGRQVLKARRLRSRPPAGQGAGGLVRRGPKLYRRGRAWSGGQLLRPERWKTKS